MKKRLIQYAVGVSVTACAGHPPPEPPPAAPARESGPAKAKSEAPPRPRAEAPTPAAQQPAPDAGLAVEGEGDPVRRAETADNSERAEASEAEGEAVAARPKEPEAPPPIPENTTVLHIGDSFAGALGIDLNRELEKHGVRSILKYETSTYIPTWAWSKELDKYLWTWRPDLVLITLGANELEHPNPEQRAETIQRLVGRLDGRPCVWIGPPLWEGARDALLEVIRDNVAPCLYMDSNELVPDLPRARDNIHPSTEARKHWAKVVVDWLARHRDPSAEEPWALRARSGQSNNDESFGAARGQGR